MKRILLPVFIIILAAAAAVMLVIYRPEPRQQAAGPPGALVRVRAVHAGAQQLVVSAAGTVRPARLVAVQPEVPGRLNWVNTGLVPGGLVEKGEQLVRIEEQDYRLAVAARQSELTQARAALALEQGQQEVAEEEWQRYLRKPGQAPADKSLATREPQMRTARARVERAEALLEQARLDLRRTTIQAPFAAVVAEEEAAVGRLVNSQSRIAVLFSTEAFWVECAVPVEFLPVINIPGIRGSPGGSAAAVVYDYGDQQVELPGSVFRLLPEIDPAGRMARLLIRVEDPYRLESPDHDRDTAGGLPLLAGSYVDVEIQGPMEPNLIEIPRTAMRHGNEVFVMNDEQKLEIREVEVAWERRDTVLVRQGLADGDLLVVSRIAAPVEGMVLRRLDQDRQRQGGVNE